VADERKRIGLREVRNLTPNSEVWDAGIKGFGARRQRSAVVAYVLLYRTIEGRSRRYTIGRHGAPWTPETARNEAQRLLGEVAKGNDPAGTKKARRHAETMAELCDLYWADAESGRLLTRHRAPKKASTLASDKGRIDKHIRPLLGALSVAAVTRSDVVHFLQDVGVGKTAGRAKSGKKRGLSLVRGGLGVAGRTVGLLGAIFSYAVANGMRTDNPAHGVTRPADGRRERRLRDDEYGRLGEALHRAREAKIWPPAIDAVRFLAVTGWRSGEALALLGREVDLARRTATLPDTKSGRSLRPLSHEAVAILQRRISVPDALVFPPTKGDGTMTGFRKLWNRIGKLGDVPRDITPHVLRHSFISLGADIGLSEPTIAALVGHKGRSVTSRYVHSADAVLLAAADAVAEETVRRMGSKPDSDFHE
jgi:integrase